MRRFYLFFLIFLAACGSYGEPYAEEEVPPIKAASAHLESWNGHVLRTFSDRSDLEFFGKLLDELVELDGISDIPAAEYLLEIDGVRMGLWISRSYAQVMKEDQPGTLWDVPLELQDQLRVLVWERPKETTHLDLDLLEPETIFDLLPWTDAVIEGVVVGEWVERHGDLIETIHELEITESIRGSLEPGSNLFVRQLGGEVEDLRVVSPAWVPFGRHETWLLFLIVDSPISASIASPFGAFRYHRHGESWRQDFGRFHNILTEAQLGRLKELVPSPYHLMIQPLGVDANSGEFELINMSELSYTFDNEIFLERLVEGTWEPVRAQTGFSEAAHLLGALEKMEIIFNWDLVFGGLENGNYRLTKVFSYGRLDWQETLDISAYFTID